MTENKILITRKIPDEGIELLKKHFEVEVWAEEKPIPYELLLEKISDKSGVLCMLSDKIDRIIMDNAPKLRIIANYAVGFDNIDINYATKKRIYVGNTPDVLTETTADLAFALLMACARRIKEGIEYVKADRWITWGPELLLGHDVYGATLGIIGFGRIGQAVARRGKGFGMRVVYSGWNRKTELEESMGVEYLSIKDLICQSDFISLNCKLTEDSINLIDEKAINSMKKNAVIINTSRGQVIDTDALYDALKSGKIFAAGLDVTDPEPLRSNHKLLELSNCVVIPHMGSASFRTRDKMSVISAWNIIDAINGQTPRFCVNKL